MRKLNSILTGFFLSMVLMQAKAQNEIANFTFTSSGTTVNFTNTSNTPASDTAMRRSLWTFGDGSSLLTHYSTNPTHAYPQFGNYQACMKLFKRVPPTTINGDTLLLVSVVCKPIHLASPDSCTANFQTVSAGTTPLGNYFIAQPWHNNQKKPEQICWTFGDGTDTCINYNLNQPPPNAYGVFHQYNQPGTYIVCVTIRYQGGCVATYCRTIQIVHPVSCTANFEINPVTATPLSRKFTAITGHIQNKKPVKICWVFGDGTDTCITYSNTYTGPYIVNHNYQQPGNFNVCVKIFYDGGCEATYCRLVVIATPDSCTANFETGNTTISLLTQHFVAIPWHSTQKKPVYICWDFGDGSDTCIQYSNTFTGPYTVTHTYAAAGQYNVCVRIVYQGGCEARKCKPVTITNPPVTCTAQIFLVTPSITSLTRGLYVVANATPARPIEKICWYFGDGTDTCVLMTGTVPSQFNFINHTYPGPGVYHACVKVHFVGGCVAYSCLEVVILSNNVVCGGYFTDSLSGPRTVKFKSFSIHNPGDYVLSYNWTFGDGTSGNGQNAVHTYNQPGIYQVCLLIKTQRGCETRICKKIVINGPNAPILQLTPNPVVNNLHALFNSTHTEIVTIRILNSSGSAVRTYTRNVTAGINQWDFDLSGLMPGIYSFVVQSPNQLASAIFIKI